MSTKKTLFDSRYRPFIDFLEQPEDPDGQFMESDLRSSSSRLDILQHRDDDQPDDAPAVSPGSFKLLGLGVHVSSGYVCVCVYVMHAFSNCGLLVVAYMECSHLT